MFLGAPIKVTAQYAQTGWPGRDVPAHLQARAATLLEMERLKFSGRFDQAIALADELERTDRAAASADSKDPNPALFQSSFLSAILHALAGNDERAIARYQAALEEVRNGVFIDPLTRSRLEAGLVQSYQGAGQIDAAIAFLASVAQDGSDDGALGSQRQVQLCRLYIKGRHLDQAATTCGVVQEREVERSSGLPVEQVLRAARVLNVRQSLFEIAGSVQDGSSILFRQADRVGNTAFSKPGVSFLSSLSPHSMLAQVYFEKSDPGALQALYDGRFRQHAALIEKALAGPAPLGFQPLEDDYARLGAYLAGAGMPVKADDALRKALRLNGDRLSFVATQYNPLLLAGTLATRRAKAGLYTSLVMGNGATDQAALKRMAGELLQTKGVQSEILAVRHYAVHASGDHALIDLYRKAEAAAAAGNESEWKMAIQALGAQIPYTSDQLYDDGERFLARINARLGRKTLVSVIRYTPFDFVRQAFGGDRYLALRLKDGQIDARDIGTVDAIDLLVQRYRIAVAADHTDAGSLRVRNLSRALYKAILEPLLGERLESGEYVADFEGMLNLLPIEALVDDSNRYLIEAGTWRYVSSARALLRDAASASSTNAAILLVNPDFESRSPASRAQQGTTNSNAFRSAAASALGRFASLSETAAEGRLIGRAMAKMGLNVSTLQGSAASASALAGLKAPRFLHIATHGFFIDHELAPQRKDLAFTNEALSGGLSAGLALAGANARSPSAEADGLFFLSQFRTLDLRGTELVVLSACDTAAGSIRIGDGVNSLRQSLELAGAHSHVTSLWKVPSLATMRLMVEFYEQLAIGTTKAESLRQAKLELIKTQPNPLFWAGFTVSGNGE